MLAMCRSRSEWSRVRGISLSRDLPAVLPVFRSCARSDPSLFAYSLILDLYSSSHHASDLHFALPPSIPSFCCVLFFIFQLLPLHRSFPDSSLVRFSFFPNQCIQSPLLLRLSSRQSSPSHTRPLKTPLSMSCLKRPLLYATHVRPRHDYKRSSLALCSATSGTEVTVVLRTWY